MIAEEAKKITLSDEFKSALENYNYPGNIRRLKMIIEKCIGQCDIEGKQIIDLQIALNASDQGTAWMGFGLDSKSDLVRFYENYLQEMDYKNKSLHDLAVEIVSSFQNDNMIEQLCNQDEMIERLKSKLQLNGSNAIGINNSTKKLINKLINALNESLGSKSIEKDKVLAFLENTDDLTIFKGMDDIRNEAVIRLSEKNVKIKEIATMLNISYQGVSQIIEKKKKEKEAARTSSTAPESTPPHAPLPIPASPPPRPA